MSTEGSSDPTGKSYSDFGEYLRDEGVEVQIKAVVEKRIIALQLEERRRECGLSKSELARRVGTSRTQLERVLDPRSQNITLDTLRRVASEMGKRIRVELID